MQNDSTQLIRRRLVIWLTLLGLLVGGLPTAPAQATTSPLRLSQERGGVLIAWDGAASALAGWPSLRVGTAMLPARLVALRANGPVALRLEQASSVVWRGGLAQAAPERPILPEGLLPLAEPLPQQALPAAPVSVLRQSRMRGVAIVVVAVTPLFADHTGLRAARSLRAFVPGAALLHETAPALLESDAPFLADAPGPASPAKDGPAWRVRVTQGGIQRLSAADLAAAGIDPAVAERLHLRRNGRELPLELRVGPDGLDELRFYAPAPGDRWNAADTYWLSVESAPGLRMPVRHAGPDGSTPERDTALERGIWRKPGLYDSLRPGPSGDHWFAAWLRSDGAPLTATLTLSPSLPLAGGDLRLTVEGAAITPGTHTLQASSAGAVAETSWSGAEPWRRTLTLPSAGDTLVLRATSGPTPGILAPDRIGWERAVRLDFGGNGGRFSGVAGRWVYRLSGVPAGAALYDISDPAVPVLLAGVTGRVLDGADGQRPRDYLLAGPGTLAEPTLAPWQATDLATPASTLYIAPAALHPALAPLVEWRRSQGRSVRVIDVQALYDGWSDGQIDPQAIRSFLRYAAATWRPAPQVVVLVGDGSVDPHNFSGYNNVSLIPPYMAPVDPWVGETACDSCYAQLDGEDPAGSGADVLPDVQLGRLPVKSVAETERLVAKLLAYEQAAPGGLWRSRAVFVADNGREADGTPDPAGDFPALSDEMVAQQPRGMAIRRVYYDPWGRTPAGQPLGESWRIADGAAAHQAVLAALNAGAGLVNYTGHANMWQWGVTALDAEPGYLLGLYEPETLQNGAALPVVLEMSCLTSAFQTPVYHGMVIDERLLLAREGGAVAVWGATGLGLVTGHALLQRGFYRALWAAPPQQVPLGGLVAAGYLELFAHADQASTHHIQSFVLLGDPLTPARVVPAQQVYMPVVHK
ncbi:MAG: C25 family cysteine peptidase [Roseiflexaceae bacterium]